MKLAFAIALTLIMHDVCPAYGDYDLQKPISRDDNSSLHVIDPESTLFDFPISRALGIDFRKTPTSENEKPQPSKKHENRRIFSSMLLAG